MKKTRKQRRRSWNVRVVIAALFLVLLLGEWTSHSLAFSHSASSEATAVHVQHGAHEDLCKTMIHCPEGPRQDIPPPSGGHHIVQQDAFSNYIKNSGVPSILADSRYHRNRIAGLFRAVSPPFHPPELS